jgi:hypothetical protein
VIQGRLREEDPEGAARREALWRETEERMERILERIRAEEADRGTAAGELS